MFYAVFVASSLISFLLCREMKSSEPVELIVFFQSRREAVKQAMVIDTTENEITSRSKAGTLLCAKKQHKKKKRTSFRSNYGKGNTHANPTPQEIICGQFLVFFLLLYF